jgi:hypothetical protein
MKGLHLTTIFEHTKAYGERRRPCNNALPRMASLQMTPGCVADLTRPRVILLAFAGVVVGGIVGVFQGWSFFNNITFKIPVYTGGTTVGSQEYDVSKIIAALGFVFGAASGSIVGALAATAQTIREATDQASKSPIRR